MAVLIKNQARIETQKDVIVTFDADNYIAVEGLEKSFFKGQTKVLHKIQAEKLIERKLVKEVKATLVKQDNKDRTVTDL